MRLDAFPGRGQTQPGTAVLRGIKRFEHVHRSRLIHPAAGINQIQGDSLSGQSRPHGKLPTVGHRLDRILDQIHQRRFQRLVVHHDERQFGIQIADNFHALVTTLRIKKSQHTFDSIVQTARRHVEMLDSRESQKIIEQSLEPDALLLDDVDFVERPAIFLRFRRSKVFGQEFHIHADDRQRVLDLMGQSAG